MRKIKVVIVTPYLSTGKDLLLYQSQQLNIASALINSGLSAEIITGIRNKDDKSQELFDGVLVTRIKSFAGLIDRFFNQIILLGLYKSLKSKEFDIVQSSEDSLFSTLIVALYCSRNNKKMILYQGIYSYSENFMKKLLMKIWDFTFTKFIQRQTHFAIAKTVAAKSFLEMKGFENIKVIPIGVNNHQFNLNDSLPIEKRTYNLLFIGNLIELKNIDLVLNVYRELVNRDKRYTLTLIGKGKLKKKIMQFISKNKLHGGINMLDGIPNVEMKKIYHSADLTLLFSKIEIFSMVLLESMASGCPVISFPLPGPADVIKSGKNGILCDFKSGVNEICSEIEDYMKYRYIDKRAVSENVIEKYSWSNVCKEYVDIYKESLI